MVVAPQAHEEIVALAERFFGGWSADSPPLMGPSPPEPRDQGERFIFSYAQEILLNNVGQRVMFDLRTELFTKLQRQEVAYYDHYPVGRIMTRLTSDVDALNELFTSGVVDILGDLVVIFAYIGMMFWLDWKLAS